MTKADVLIAIDAKAAKYAPRELSYELAEQLDADATEFADELIEGLIGRISMAVLYGDSNSGKTFLGIDMGGAVARKIEWMDRQVDGGMVVYLATESPASVRNRLRAYQRHHACIVPNFVIVSSPINLFDGAADTAAVIALIQQLESDLGAKCELVIGDTLARLSAGANENSGEDMTTVLAHLDRIKNQARTAVLLIHHCGKDAAKGMRGWSGLRAAVDTELEVTSDDLTGTHSLEITKQRDMAGKGNRIGFRLELVQMGLGKWGKPQTSCVVVPADAPAKTGQSKRPSEIAGAIVEMLTMHGAGCLKGRIAKHFEARYASSMVYREIKKMTGDGRLVESAGVVALPGRPGVSA